MNIDQQPVTGGQPFNPEWVKDELFSEEELSVAIADIKSFDRPLTPERPVTLVIALAGLIFAALLLGAVYVVSSQFNELKAMHFLTLGTVAASVAILGIIHVLAARIRSI